MKAMKSMKSRIQHFNNELITAICTLVGSKHAFSTPYHPQTNGQTERFNATFATQLFKYCNEEKSNWDIYPPSIVFAYNNTQRRTTGFTPYQLAFGRLPRNPFDSPCPDFKFRRPNDYWLQVQRFRTYATQMARRNIQQQLSKQRYDQNRNSPSYNIGDLV
ncbi:unnamed protein product [Didymodactylos carnosus]|uniref:Integrase catalytic domain-containing protein n=1 Tax=Didymodactylos carnosus TaxID=1234261 RepID=A0A815W6X9_9BILA|nr:unnamed protein product [Didymodactylos carnosus]CAF1539924.1 unnamed protein product [Didymodactylos carnosus]CAF4221502.1 unnamed protein product [Didymodactylos carnosus]CAF4400181.1 unnamed protein product [Didymodactylos carnosus]